MKPITAKIDVTKIAKEYLFRGKKGTYLDLVIWPNKNGEDEYGNTHMICQGVSKEARARGEKGPIVGNMAVPEDEPPPREQARPTPSPAIGQDVEEDDIPF